MASTRVDIPIQSVMRRITLHVRVTGQTRWKIRTWLAVRLLKAAAFVMGCNIQVDLEP